MAEESSGCRVGHVALSGGPVVSALGYLARTRAFDVGMEWYTLHPSGRLLMRARDFDRTHGSARARTPVRRPETEELPEHLPLALQSSLGNAAVVQMLRQGAGSGTGDGAGPTPVQRAGDWKNNPTKNALATEKAANPGNALVHTLHHIVPKSLLEKFAGLLTATQLTDVVTALAPVAPTAFTSNSAQLNAVSKALKNVPANFALGPEPAVRNDDPGSSGADLNFTEDGAITPRSEQLERVYDFIEAKVSAGAAVAQADLQSDFIDPLRQACVEHNAVIARLGLANGVGLDPNRTAWSGDAATRSQHRTHMIEPLV
ncbi:hypothetical protein [Streptomyces sp. NPDC102437]|uniref:hypothetical protein n=1 Tax=Streptomyces sp. NPDC102437 TaxID=3366175 RepID=UPI00380958D2